MKFLETIYYIKFCTYIVKVWLYLLVYYFKGYSYDYKGYYGVMNQICRFKNFSGRMFS
jgi:hypothetical protein